MTASTEKKWYVNIVNAWLTECGGFLKDMIDNTPTVSFENMYPSGQYDLVELSEKVVVIANVTFTSVVIFLKDIATIEVNLELKHRRLENGEYEQDDEHTVTFTINDDEKFSVLLSRIVSLDEPLWKYILLNYVKEFVYSVEPEIADKMSETETELNFNLINWDTMGLIKKSNMLHVRQSRHSPKSRSRYNK